MTVQVLLEKDPSPLQAPPRPSAHKAKYIVIIFGLWMLGWTAKRWIQRWGEEAHENQVAIAADWNEFRDLAARRGGSEWDGMRELRRAGINALLLTPLTLNELVLQHRLLSLNNFSTRSEPLDVKRLRFHDTRLARQVYEQLSWRGVSDLTIKQQGNAGILERHKGTFVILKDIELGFDPVLLNTLRSEGLFPILRLNYDPWTTPSGPAAWVQHGGLPSSGVGVVFNSEELPGGLDAMGAWRSWLIQGGVTQFLFEFRPSRAAFQMAKALPSHTFRSHAIPTTELKDLNPAQQFSRWRRALLERSCRLLFLHVSPNDAVSQYLDSVARLRGILSPYGLQGGIPRPRTYWSDVTFLQRWVFPGISLVLAMVAPLLGLFLVCYQQSPLPWWGRVWVGGNPSWLFSFCKLSGITLLGAFCVAAWAQNPQTRLEIATFPGIKIAFLLPWLGSVAILYPRKELRAWLTQGVRKWEILLGVALLSGVGYVVWRSGNVSAQWKPAVEQPIRDFLESAFLARPRFKELAGHPLLLVGLYLHTMGLGRTSLRWDFRPLIVLGFVGQVSMMNTFCHLHSPLKIEIARTLSGLIVGMGMGLVAIGIVKRVLCWRTS